MNGDYIIPGNFGDEQKGIESYTYQTFYPENNSSLNTYDDTRFRLNNQETNFHFHEGYFLIKGQILKNDGNAIDENANVTLCNNGVSYIFRNVAWSINGIDVENVNYTGQVGTMMKFIKSNGDQRYTDGLSECWSPDTDNTKAATNKGREARKHWMVTAPSTKGYFCFALKLRDLFGLAENVKFIHRVSHEFKLMRQADYFALNKDGNDEYKIDIKSITMHLPIVTLKDNALLKYKENILNNVPQEITYLRRYATMMQIPSAIVNHTWTVQTMPFNQRAKYMIIGFQIDGKMDQTSNYGLFQNANIQKMTASINQVQIPQYDYEVNFGLNDFYPYYKYMEDLKSNFFQISDQIQQIGINPASFKDLTTFYCFDLTKREHEYIGGTVDIKINMQFRTATVEHTSCFALLLNEQELNIHPQGSKVSSR